MDVDPNVDFVSLYVSGLTNAFQQDGEGSEAPYRRKALQLNFFRPGDAMNQTEDRIRFGVPSFENAEEQAYVLDKYSLPEPLDYRWVFRSVQVTHAVRLDAETRRSPYASRRAPESTRFVVSPGSALMS